MRFCIPRHRATLIALLPALLAGCATTTNLMPTPIAHQMIGTEVYADRPDQPAEDRSPTTKFFYATNRIAKATPSGRTYANGVSDNLEFGVVAVRIGDPRMEWQTLLEISTQGQRRVEIPVDLEQTMNTGALALGEDPASAPQAQSFAQSINRALDGAENKDIFLYVHGAKSNFQRSMQQAAQFHHFMAQDNVFISLSWPTTQSFLTYGTDVKHAVKTVEPFADLLEFLAQNTKAEKINILAYSAGSQVVSPGLFALRQRYEEKGSSELKRHLRLGEVYFAAPDIATRVFAVDHLPVFSDMVNRTTFTFNDEDTVLGLSQQMNGVSRVGRPDIKDLSEEEIGWLKKAAQDSSLNVIDMSYEPVKRDVDFKPHGDWYLNPWASSDVIIQFLFSADPADRGLLQKPDTPVWYYPADYPERLAKIIQTARQADL